MKATSHLIDARATIKLRQAFNALLKYMHELMMTQTILDTAVRYATAAQTVRITDLYFVVGQFSDVADESVQFYWDQISPGTLCAGAQLHFDHIAANFKCLHCDHEFSVIDEFSACPHCASEQVRIISGTEFRLSSITTMNADELSPAAIDEEIHVPEHQH